MVENRITGFSTGTAKMVTLASMDFCLLLANVALANVEPAKIRHLMKKAYCEEWRGQPIYRREELETDCSEKVQIFGNQVSDNRFKVEQPELV